MYKHVMPSTGSAGQVPNTQPRRQTVSGTQDIAGSGPYSSDRATKGLLSAGSAHTFVFFIDISTC